jgi:hypothetical protein
MVEIDMTILLKAPYEMALIGILPRATCLLLPLPLMSSQVPKKTNKKKETHQDAIDALLLQFFPSHPAAAAAAAAAIVAVVDAAMKKKTTAFTTETAATKKKKTASTNDTVRVLASYSTIKSTV